MECDIGISYNLGSGRFRPPGPAPLVSLAKAPVAAYFAHIMPVPYSPAWLYIGTMATGPRGDPGGKEKGPCNNITKLVNTTLNGIGGASRVHESADHEHLEGLHTTQGIVNDRSDMSCLSISQRAAKGWLFWASGGMAQLVSPTKVAYSFLLKEGPEGGGGCRGVFGPPMVRLAVCAPSKGCPRGCVRGVPGRGRRVVRCFGGGPL